MPATIELSNPSGEEDFLGCLGRSVEESGLSSFSSCRFRSRHHIGKDHTSQPKRSVTVAAGAPAPQNREAPALRIYERSFRQIRSEKRI